MSPEDTTVPTGPTHGPRSSLLLVVGAADRRRPRASDSPARGAPHRAGRPRRRVGAARRQGRRRASRRSSALHRELLEELGVRVRLGRTCPVRCPARRGRSATATRCSCGSRRSSRASPRRSRTTTSCAGWGSTTCDDVAWLPADLPIVGGARVDAAVTPGSSAVLPRRVVRTTLQTLRDCSSCP